MNLELLAKETLEQRRSYTKLVENTLLEARREHGMMHSYHEGFGVLWEEFIELQTEMFKKKVDKTALLLELASVSAMCQRIAEDVMKTKEVKED